MHFDWHAARNIKAQIVSPFKLRTGASALCKLCMIITFAIHSLGCRSISESNGVPIGAAELGKVTKLFDIAPTLDSISPDGSGVFAWYSGLWFAKSPPPLSLYTEEGGYLAIQLGGELASISRDLKSNKMPLLPGNHGFYIEFEVRLTDSDQDHFPALWLMPIEHNSQKDDHYYGDPPSFQRWMELDVDEGGFGPGPHAAVHNWNGIWPKYVSEHNRDGTALLPIDRTQWRTFGASYQPKKQLITWWINGEKQLTAGPPYVPAIAANQNFYMILSAKSHGKNKPYRLLIRRVRGYSTTSVFPAHLQIGGE